MGRHWHRGGVAVDLIADLTGGTYQATDTGLPNNGLSGSFGQLHTKGSRTLEFTFTLVLAGSTEMTESSLVYMTGG